MQADKEQEFTSINLNTLLEKAYDCEVRVVGAVKEIFQHKRYIVELFLNKQVAIRCLKRYSQFEALHQVLQMNFKNIDLGLEQFPSKFQMVNRQETRRRYFERMLNQIIRTYLQKMTNQTNRRLLSTFYVFLVGSQPKNNQSQHSLLSDNTRKRGNSNDSGSLEDHKQMYESAHLMDSLQENKRKMQVKGEQQSLKRPMVDQKGEMGAEEMLRLFMATEFMIRFQDEQEWKERYLKLDNTCLLIYKHKNENHFKSKVQLFQAKIQYSRRNKNVFDHFCQKMQLDNEPCFPQNTQLLTVSHQYDFKKLIIKVKDSKRLSLQQVKQLLNKASRQKLINEIEGVFSPIGKLFVVLHKIIFTSGNPKTLPIFYLRIRSSGLVYESKRMTYSFNTSLNIKQTFMLPISNAFANVLIEVVIIQNDGIIRQGSQQKCIGHYKISFADYLSHPSGHGLERVYAKIQPEIVNTYNALIQLSIINYSHPSSLYADSFANENDGVIMSGLKSTSDTDELVVTVDRVLRVIGNIALFITAFWRNVYLFKYPRISYAFFSALILLFNFASAFFYFRLLFYSLIAAALYHLPPTRLLILFFMQKYIFAYIHPNFSLPLCLSANQLKFLQWTTNLKAIRKDYRLLPNGKLQKTQEAKDKKYEQWSFRVHGKIFQVREECPGLIQKVFEVKKIIELVLRMISAAINTLQKVFNILSWADRRRSAIIFCILLFVANVANTYIFQAIGTVFCIHRLYKGISFYQNKHYANNRKLAVYSLRYILNQQFSHLIPHPTRKIESTQQLQIEKALENIYFPFRDENTFRKLKQSIEHILGVYIDDKELALREEKTKENRNTVALIHLVTVIQTCEARLKLEWISGQEGSSDEFQQLKKLTNEELVIDLWVESLLINFFLNVPSQTYTTFRPVRSSESLNLQRMEGNAQAVFKRIKI